jgi:tetratricopeptide (TPR) repeat protein/RecA/RadA recombinase
MKVGDLVDGRYRLLDTLGEGAAGKVFRAEDLGANRRLIALKLLHAKDPRWEGFFRKEFEILSRLQHPNLVRVYDFGTAPGDNSYYFTQELVIGKPLLDATAGKKVDEVLALFIEVARALEFIHGHAVLHRDLKPANILVQLHAQPGERVRVLDFGLWRELDNTPQKAARWAGTPPYLASEVLRGFGHSITADLYAVGITLFQVLTRKLPHGRGTPQELLQQRKQPVPSLYDLGYRPAELSDLVASLLHEEPAQRPQSAAELGAALGALTPGSEVTLPTLLGRARLVGREAEAASLLAMLPVEGVGGARIIWLTGNAGIGKSRMAHELKAEAQLGGHKAALSSCNEDGASLQPMADVLRTLAPSSTELSAASMATLMRVCPELATPGSAEVRGTQSMPVAYAGLVQEVARHHARRVMNTKVATDDGPPAARGGGVVMIIENVGRADDATVAVLEALTGLPADVPLVLVLTDDGEAAAQPRWHNLMHERARVVELHPLGIDNVGKLLAGLLGVAEVPLALRDTMHAQSGGNPLLIEELLALLVDRGELVRGPRGWDLQAFVKPAAVLTLQNIDTRLAKLTSQERTVLTALAVFNRPSGPKLLAAVADLDLGTVRSALASSANHGLVRVAGADDGRPRIVFRHPHVRDVLLRERRDAGDLARWHARCAEVLIERGGDARDAMAETIGRHQERAGQTTSAAASYALAAVHALQSLDFSSAADLGRRAARLLDGQDRRRGTVEATTVSGLLWGGRPREGRVHAHAVLERAASLSAADAAAVAVVVGEATALLGSDDDFARHIEKLQRHAGMSNDPWAKARLSLARALWLLRRNPQRALRDADAAMPLIPNHALRDRSIALATRATAALLLGEVDVALKDSAAMLDLVDGNDNPGIRLHAQRIRAMVLSYQGQRLESRKLIHTALTAAQQLRHHTEEVLLQSALGDELYLSGAYSEAIGRFQAAAATAAELGLTLPRTYCVRMVGGCYLLKGDYDRALGHLRAALDARDAHPAGGDDPVVVRCDIVHALLAKNQRDDARAMLHEAQALAGDAPQHVSAQLHIAQGMVAVAFNDHAARGHFVRAMWMSRQLDHRYRFGEAATGLAMFYLRDDKATQSLRIGMMAQRRFLALDAQGQLRRLGPLLNAAGGLARRHGRSR